MVHWTIYPVLGIMIALFAWFSYYYLRRMKAMDRLNEDHWEYLRTARIVYFTAEPGRFTGSTFDAHRRFPVEEGVPDE